MLAARLKNYLKNLGMKNTSLVKNLNYNYSSNQRKILICYLDFRHTSQKIDNMINHPNQIRFMEIIKCFIDFDFCIDTCECNDLSAVKYIDFDKYDYIFGFGKIFDYAVEKRISAKKIIYMTEAPYAIAEKAEKIRVEYFYQRHSFYPPHKRMRTGEYYSKNQERKADMVVFQGERKHFNNLNIPLIQVYTTAFINEKLDLKTIQKRKNRCSFIIFGTSGNWIRKGADLLLEAFSRHPDLRLYVCGSDMKKYTKELRYKDIPLNIIDVGFVDYRSDKFIELFKECAYIVLPSCFEGMSSAIATGMAHAAIPIVSHNIGYDDLSDYCLYFNEDTVEEVENAIISASRRETSWIETHSLKCAQFARENFTIDSYSEKFREFVNELD